jgi:flagellar basal-body rod modification protein FlgD
VAQMQHMDPLNTEGGDQEFIGQMTQFSMLEQITNLAKASERSSTFALIGRTVTYKKSDGSTGEGTVESVDQKGDKLTLTVAGQAGVDPNMVTAVR